MLGGGAEFSRVRVFETADVSGELDHHCLHAEADSEVRDSAFTGEADGIDFAFDAALSEAARMGADAGAEVKARGGSLLTG